MSGYVCGLIVGSVWKVMFYVCVVVGLNGMGWSFG